MSPRNVRAELARLAERFPSGVDWRVRYDPTQFVAESIGEVFRTLVTAVLLVFLVVYVFLQDWRTTLIPAVTIPVSLIGTLAVLNAIGLSINTITLFALVLAIGLVVDDAIVVVENVARLIGRGIPRREAVAPLDGRGDERDRRLDAGARRGLRARRLPAGDDGLMLCASSAWP